MKKIMMIRNTMCIFALFSIIVLFFCFGAVANAAEDTEEEKETYTYNATYKVPFVGGYTEVVIDGTYENRLCFYKTDDGVALCVNIAIETNTPISPSIQKFITRYQNGNVQYTQLSTSFEGGDLYDIKGNIPIFDGTTEAGKAAALEYLKTGDDSGKINKPDWSEGSKDNSFGLNTFSGSLDGSNLITSWNGVSSRVVDISNYKNTGVRSVFTFKTADGLEDVEGKVYKISDNGFSIDVSSLSDGSFYSVTLTPFYYSGDDVVSGKLRLGVDSIFYNPDAVSGYDGDLFNIKNCQYVTVPPLSCHGDVKTSGCFKLTWTPDGIYNNSVHDTFEVKLYAKVSVAFDTDVKRNYYTFCFPVGYTDVKTVSGQYSFCTHDIANFLYSNGYIKKNSVFASTDMGAFQINEVYKLYIRTVREDVSSGSRKYGNWSVYDFNTKKWYENNQQDISDGRIVIGDTDPDPENGDISGGDGGKINLPDKPGNDSGLKIGDLDFSDIGSIGKFFISLVNSLIQVIGSFPSLFASVFVFLPSELISMIYLGIVLVIIIGLIKAFL